MHQSSEAMQSPHGKDCSSRFLPKGNGHSWELHPFGCGNSLVVNRDDMGIGLRLRLRSFVWNVLACDTKNNNGSDECHLCFTARKYVTGDNDRQFDVAIVQIMEVFTADNEAISGEMNHSVMFTL